jgi:hypothetical protein
LRLHAVKAVKATKLKMKYFIKIKFIKVNRNAS